MAEVRILKQYCKGCALCVEICPKGVLEISTEFTEVGTRPVRARSDVECSGCMLCYTMCPDAAIEIIEVEPAGAELEE